MKRHGRPRSNIADNSAFISQSRDFIDVFNRMTPSQRLGFVASIPGSMYGGLVDWFSDLYSKMGKGCYEDAARQIGNAIGQEALEALSGIKGAKAGSKAAQEALDQFTDLGPVRNASGNLPATRSKKSLRQLGRKRRLMLLENVQSTSMNICELLTN